ncbi:MAG: hypothetical protein KF746_09150 [Chitinophagaceae bacterium]|nr:hypothetical protein [Chitinophagaceae bacterium]
MQLKRTLVVIIACFSIAVFCIYTIPVHRSYLAEIEINADNLITYRTLLDTSNWNRWYNHNNQMDGAAQHSISITPDQQKKQFEYVLHENENETREGGIQIIKSNKWNSKIKWTEKLVIEKDIQQKIKLLFSQEEFRGAFLQNVIQFKNHIEHPDNIFGGITFERRDIPAKRLVILSDTVAISDIEAKANELYQFIIHAVPQKDIIQKDIYISQHEILDDSLAYVRVGVSVTDDLLSVKAPLDVRDTEEHPAIVMRIAKGYTEINEDISIMYEWLKKNDARPSTGFWIEHSPSVAIAQNNVKHPLTIIQEFYSIK